MGAQCASRGSLTPALCPHPPQPCRLLLAVNTLSACTACAALYCLQDDYIDDTMDAENYESSFEEWGAS